MAAPTFHVAATPANGTASPAALNAPGTRSADDILIISVSMDATNRTVTTPGGWTLVEGPITSSTQRGYVFARKADGTATDNFSGTLSGSTNWLCNMVAYSGCDVSGALLTTSIIAHSSRSDASGVTAMTTASVSTHATDACLLVGMMTADAVSTNHTFSPTSTSPATGTPNERYDNFEGTGHLCSTGVDTDGFSLTASTGYTITATCNGTEVGTEYALMLKGVSSSPVTATPGTASLTTTTFAPVVSAPRLVTPGKLSLTTTQFAPSVTVGVKTTIGLKTLSLTTFAPTIVNPKSATPGKLALTLTTFAPVVTAGVSAVPGKRSLSLTAFAPTVAISQNQKATIGLKALSLSTFAPSALAPRLATIGKKSLTLSTFAPTVTATANQRVVPGTVALTLSPLAPTVTGSGVITGFSGGRLPLYRRKGQPKAALAIALFLKDEDLAAVLSAGIAPRSK